jgi:hypothetical protein
VANVFWSHRLYRATGESKYIDVLERTLYNGLISGIGFDGCHFFYPNPLESDGSFERAGWFDCSCCPVNVARFMPAMEQYIYSVSEDQISVNLFVSSEASFELRPCTVGVSQNTDYPWSGKVEIKVTPASDNELFGIRIRIPAWTGDEPFDGGLYRYITPAAGKAVVEINGSRVDYEEKNGFMVIERKWRKGDMIKLLLPMEPRFIVARDEVVADSGRVAVGVGPIVYCLEEADNGKVREITIDPTNKLKYMIDSEYMNGTGVVLFNATLPDGSEKQVKAIPYYSWANRGRGEMIVWIKTK